MASKMTIPIACALVVLFAGYDTEGKSIVGMNWGRQSAQRLLPSQVVDLLLQNGIENARVYTGQIDILEAFAGSGINLTVGIFNHLSLKSIKDARAWVDERREYIVPSNIRSIYLGGYVFDIPSSHDFIASSLRTLRLIQTALNEDNIGRQIKANFVHYELELKPKKLKPSEAEFRDEIKEQMIEFLEFLKEIDAPFVIQLNPLWDATETEIHDITFAFPDGKSNTVIKDTNGFVYTNVIQWRIDSYLWAISKLVNASDIKILIGMIGWSTDGLPGATVANAERFWKLLLPWLTSNQGTPLRPGEPIDFFAHSLTDETQMPLPFARHWGIYRSNGMPKYKIDLTGQDRDMYPANARGIMHMPHRWCLFNGDRRDPYKVNRVLEWACNQTDCSSVAPGGTCSGLDFVQKVSFAFNMYFQFQFQDEFSCNFEGLAALSTEDPSKGDCVFPIEVVKGRQNNYVPAKLIQNTNNGAIVSTRLNNNPALFVFVMLVFIV